MQRLVIGGLFLVVGSACSFSHTIVGSDGSKWTAIDCHRNYTNCLERAGEECPSGYDVIQNGGMEASVLYGHYRGRLIIRCHGQSREDLESGR